MPDEQMATIGQLIQAAESGRSEVARQRARLRTAWLSGSREIEQVQAQIRSADATIGRREKATDELMKRFDVIPDDRTDHVVPTLDRASWFQPAGVGNWTVKSEIEQRFDAELATAQRKFSEAQAKTFSGGLRRVGQEALGRYEAWLQQLMEVRSAMTAELDRLTTARAQLIDGGKKEKM